MDARPIVALPDVIYITLRTEFPRGVGASKKPCDDTGKFFMLEWEKIIRKYFTWLVICRNVWGYNVYLSFKMEN